MTKRQILDAAQRLFERQGYTVTSMAAIAAEAAVALKTVYIVSVSERAWYLEVTNEPDPHQQLRINARNSRLVKERAASLMRVIRDAAASDADSAALWSLIQSEFHANQATIVASLHEKGALRDDLDLERATDILWTLNHPDIWQLLVVQRGWSPDDYEKWFADAARAQLLTQPG